MNTFHDAVFFVSGSYAFGLLLCGLIFLRFYLRARAPLLLTFAITFELMFLEKVLLLVYGQEASSNSMVYLVRLFGFILILWGIWNHNRRREPAATRAFRASALFPHEEASS